MPVPHFWVCWKYHMRGTNWRPIFENMFQTITLKDYNYYLQKIRLGGLINYWIKTILNFISRYTTVLPQLVSFNLFYYLNHFSSSVHGVLQARILEWVDIPFSRGSSQPRELNLGLLHCRLILYCLSHQGSPTLEKGHVDFWCQVIG